MASGKTMNVFSFNILCWKIFGLWPSRRGKTYYKFYSFVYILTTLVVYNILLTANLLYTPRNIEAFIQEVIFYFTEIVVMSKAAMVLLMSSTIIESFELLDSNALKSDVASEKITEKHTSTYRKLLKYNAIVCNTAFLTQMLPPLFVSTNSGELPICNYYFLAEETRLKYYYFWYIYQTIGMYGHMMYNVTIDTFISGMIFLGIGHFKALRVRLANLNISDSNTINDVEGIIQMEKLRECLQHYDILLRLVNPFLTVVP